MAMGKPFSMQAPEDVAKEYGGNKQSIAKAAQMGLLDPTTAVMAGMFIDRMREAQAQEQQQTTTVAEQVFNPQPAPQGMPAQPPMPQGMPAQPPIPRGMPAQPPMPRGMGATPQAAQMQAMQQKMAPRPSVAGMNQLPMGPGMIPKAASGGLLAFAGGGDVPGYAPGGMPDNPLYGEIQTKEARLKEEQSNLERALVPLRRRKDLGLSSPALDATEARLLEVQNMITGLPNELAQNLSGPEISDAVFMEEAYRGGDGAPIVQEQLAAQVQQDKAQSDATVTTPETQIDTSQLAGLGNTPTAVKAAEEGVISRDGVLAEDMPGANSQPSFYDIPGLTDREVPVDREAEAYKKFEELRSEGPVTVEKTPDKGPSVAEQERANRTPFVPDFMSSSADDLTADTTLADTTADIDAIANKGLGEEEKAALDYYKKAEERANKGKEDAIGYMLIDIGANMMASDSPYFLQAAGKAISSGAEKYKADIDKQVAAQESALSKRAAFDVTRRNRQIENLKLSLDKYKGDARNEISAKITSLQEGNKVDLARMDDNTRREMQLLNLISTSQEKQADREHTSRENQANRFTQERITTLNNLSRAAEGKLERDFKFSLQEKQNAFADARLQANLMFQGDQNRLKRENALKVVEMQLNNPSDLDTQINAFEKRILEEAKANNLTMTDADARAQAVQAVYDGQAMVANAAKFDVAASQVIDNAYKLAVDSWNAMTVKPKDQTFEKFVDQIVNNYMGQISKNTNILGNRPGRASGMETYADFRTPRQ